MQVYFFREVRIKQNKIKSHPHTYTQQISILFNRFKTTKQKRNLY